LGGGGVVWVRCSDSGCSSSRRRRSSSRRRRRRRRRKGGRKGRGRVKGKGLFYLSRQCHV
jgi:hypothetical protein